MNIDEKFKELSRNVILYCYSKSNEALVEQQRYTRFMLTGMKKNILEIYSDSYVSNSIKNKSNLLKMLDENYDVDIVISSVDRLTRNMNEMIEIKNICNKNKLRIFSIKEREFVFDNFIFDAIKEFIEIIKDGDSMGYRSDVRIITTKKGYKELKKVADEYANKYDSSNLLESPDILEVTKKGCYIGWNWIKWYEEYEEVDAIVKGLDLLEEKNISYRFARCGESYDDYEEFVYDSEKDNGSDLDYPPLIREFDDDYIIEGLNQDKKSVKENELCN